MNMHRNIKNDQFLAKICIFATFPSNLISLKLTPKVIVLGSLMQIIKCPILVVTMKPFMATRIHVLDV